LTVSKWIDSFNPKQPNDFMFPEPQLAFDMDNVQQQVSSQFNAALNELQAGRLSPNKPSINESILKARDKLKFELQASPSRKEINGPFSARA
jgi:hypothetical protein